MADPRHLIIANPQARHGETEKLLPVIERLLQNVPHDTVITERIGHATEIAAAADGLRRDRRRRRRRDGARGPQRRHVPPRRFAPRAGAAADGLGQRHPAHARRVRRSRAGRRSSCPRASAGCSTSACATASTSTTRSRPGSTPRSQRRLSSTRSRSGVTACGCT